MELEKGNDNSIKLANGIWGNKKELKVRPDKTRIETWKTKLTLYQQYYIYECLKNETYLQRMDYDIIPKENLNVYQSIFYKLRSNASIFIYIIIQLWFFMA